MSPGSVNAMPFSEFQSARPLRRAGRCRLSRSTAEAALPGFNPRPPPKSGAIRSSAFEPSSMRFQSAPPSEERGDTASASSKNCRQSFNPRPPPKSGAIAADRSRDDLRRDVSIRAPLRRAGRCRDQALAALVVLVSIRAPLRRAGRCRIWSLVMAWPRFNPRPPPKSGAIRAGRQAGPGGSSFNPRPPPKSGAMSFVERIERLEEVSIRAPLRRAGRLPPADVNVYKQSLFQSAPPSEERGDRARTCRPCRRCGFNPRPPPKSGAMWYFNDWDGDNNLFQSAPPSEERGDSVLVAAWNGYGWFQSAPPSEERGDLGLNTLVVGIELFQSAPPSEERGDDPPRSRAPRRHCFNPRPPPKSGAMTEARSRFVARKSFQSAPPSEERGDTAYCPFGLGEIVSIRAPLRRAGRSPSPL